MIPLDFHIRFKFFPAQGRVQGQSVIIGVILCSYRKPFNHLQRQVLVILSESKRFIPFTHQVLKIDLAEINRRVECRLCFIGCRDQI